VQQAGSHVAPDRLRFDFQHFEALTAEQIDRVETLANHEVITDAPVRHYETTKEHAESLGAMAFFGDKYGDVVRVLEAGEHSIELCGGTHVHALGFIGPVKIVSEGSIGANLRRIEAVTGEGALARIRDEERTLRAAADALRASPEELVSRVQALVEESKAKDKELGDLRARMARHDAQRLAADASHRTEVDGTVVVAAPVPGASADVLQLLARAAVAELGSGIVALAGSGDGAKASLVVAVSKDLVARGVKAGEIAGPAARAIGGGTGRNADLAVGGGPKVDGLEEALELARRDALAAVAAAPVAAGG
jgi:alanyl-tRNA synthetase